MIIKHFKKELGMTKEDNQNFKNSTKCCICENDYVDKNVKIRYNCHITGKYRGSVNIDFNMHIVVPWCSGYHYCTSLFTEAWSKVLRRFKSCLGSVGDTRWLGSLTMVQTGNKINTFGQLTIPQKQFIIMIIIITLKLNYKIPVIFHNLKKLWF